MGFDNECIANIQSLPGEYFCPVCRTLIYPTEALQTQCTHLYCKPCLAHTVATTQACPYDGYLVTAADSKPLMELNKPLADVIGKVQVHCLYYRSSCQWQGTLSDCIIHCATCPYGNSPVLCNRCGTQIMHRQVQEHAQVCPVLPPQVSQPMDPTQPQATAATATQFAGQNAYATPTATAAPTGASVPASTPEDQWYQQQYYQQYPGYDPYAQYTQQPQPQVAPVGVQPPQSQSTVPQMQTAAPQSIPPQHLQAQQLQQQPQPPQLQPLPQHPPLQPLPTPHSQLQLTPQGHNPTPSSVTGYSSYPQSQHAPTHQPHMQMLPPQQPLTPPPQGPYAPQSQQMAAHQHLHPVGPGPHVQQFGPPHLHGQTLTAGVPPMGLIYGTPPPPQFQPSPGSLKVAFTDETNGKIKEVLKEKGSDDKTASKVGPIPSQNTPPATLSHERYPPPYGHSPDVPPYGQGQIRMPHSGSIRPYGEVAMRPSMGTSPQTMPDAFDPIGWQPQSSFDLPLSAPGMGRSNGLHAPLRDEGLMSYPRQPLEGLSRYERSSYPSKQPEFYGRGGTEFGHGPPPFRGPGRHEYDGASSNKYGADYERSRLPFNFPPADGRSGAKRFGESVGHRRYSGPGHMPSENFGAIFPGGKGSSIERSRKRRFSAGGWCRICKIDCGTAEGLDSHSQSKDHKKMALDMIFSIKQQVLKNPKLLVEYEVAEVKGVSDHVELDTTS